MKITARVRKVDEELEYRQTEIRYSGGSVDGPTRSTSYGLDMPGAVAEGYREFDKSGLERIVDDADIERSVEREMKRKNVPGALNLFFVNYTQLTPLHNKELDALVDLEYVCSEVAVTPCWSGLMKGKVDDGRVDALNQWNAEAIETIERLNNKSIMGVVPSKVHRKLLGNVIKTFVDRDVTLFTIDHMGRSVKSSESWLRALYSELKEYGLMDNTMIYGLNAPEGRLGQKKGKVLAGDFISSAYGLDIIGINHIRNARPPGPPGPGNGPDAPPPEINYRLFDGSTYAYNKLSETQARTQFTVPPSRVREEIKRHNILGQLDEYANLGQVLKEEPTALGYIQTKEMVDNALISSIKKVRGERRARQRTLFD